MFPRPLRLNLQDGSPGGGAAPAPSTQPAPQANGAGPAASAPTIDVGSIVQQVRDGVFADLRRSGVFGKQPKDQEAPPPPKDQPAGSPAALTLDDVNRMLERRDALHNAVSGVSLSEGARKRMLAAYEAEKPEDVSVWAKGYLADFGLGQSSAPGTNPSTQPRPQPTGPSISNGGVPAPTGVTPSDDVPLFRLSMEDRAHLLKTKGAAAFRERFISSMRGATVRLK